METRKRVQKKLKVILDTDIGDDIDDTWALIMMLKSNELDPILITTCFGDTAYRTNLVAKILQLMKRTDIPIGVGASSPHRKEIRYQADWLKDFDTKQYTGVIHNDAVQSIITTVMNHEEDDPITLLCIGPLTNIGSALRIEPRIAQRAKLVGMLGSIRKGYAGSSSPMAEYNVKVDIDNAKQVFEHEWKHGLSFTPLDTCGVVKLEGEKYKKIMKEKEDIGVRIILENYQCWAEARKWVKPGEEPTSSSILFDVVPVYMCFKTKLLNFENLPIKITDDGMTVIDNEGSSFSVQVATTWKDLSAFNHFLVNRLIQKSVSSNL